MREGMRDGTSEGVRKRGKERAREEWKVSQAKCLSGHVSVNVFDCLKAC